jgi:biotin-dependent carboxylase-like uncharacterized protein
MSETAALRVIQPGMLTTVQDLGRSGLARYGVAPGGALDRRALILGNRLLGNDPGGAGLEVTLVGPELVATGSAVVAVTGADLGAQLNGASIPRWQPILIEPGDVISFAPGSGDGVGARAYLCVAGGFAIEPALGSRSTDLVGQFGGLEGRPLRAGDVLPLRGREDRASLLNRRLSSEPAVDSGELMARVVLGPQAERFTRAGIETFLSGSYEVTARADRTGIRLAGPVIEHSAGADLISEGIAAGAIQVPGDGQPFVLLAARPTVGGYPKIATVIGVDLERFGQLRPGIRVRFTDISPEEARTATLAYWQAVDDIQVIDASLAPPSATGAGSIAAGMREVVETLKASGMSSFRIEGPRYRLDLEFRGPDRAATSYHTPPVAPQPKVIVVSSPALGRFFRRREPDEPPLAEENTQVAAGDALGVIEVMKTYHEVTAPVTGLLTAFLAEDQQVVEYGQPIARIEVVRG